MAYSRALAVTGQAIELICEFRYDDSGLLFDPAEVISVQILDENQTTVLETITTIQKLGVGIYKVVTDPTYNTTSRLLYDKWGFKKNVGGTIEYGLLYTLVHTSSTVTNLTLINKLRILLKDSHPQVDKRRYTDLELELYLDNALLDINVCPPAFTDYTLTNYETYVPSWQALILQGGIVFSLISEGIFQIGIEFDYNDNGISISTSRSGKYQAMAQMILNTYQTKKELMKKQYWFQTSYPRALLSCPLPYKIRALSPCALRLR
ncbi:MAG: hypothetical protein PHP92_04910 [Candidatus Nanoarchaeia archaeon]|nr:hypothetical protein [Candidatus Nanoarchaeia archaeon]